MDEELEEVFGCTKDDLNEKSVELARKLKFFFVILVVFTLYCLSHFHSDDEIEREKFTLVSHILEL